MPAFYEQILWIPEKFCFTNLDLHHGLLGVFESRRRRSVNRCPHESKTDERLVYNTGILGL
jgi:hypothetical protein